MKALIKVGYGCNNHCSFCHTLDVREVDGPSREVHEKIERAAKLGHSMIVLSGGEVTMRPELLAWAKHSASLGLTFGLVTNGRMLAYPALVEKLLGYRLAYVYLSMHGGTAKIHNLLVRADAFEQTYAAVKNLAGRGLDFTVNTVVTRQNLRHLRGVVDAMLPFPDVVLKFSMVQPKGGGEKLFDHLIPSITEVAESVRDAITYGLERSGGNGPKFAHDGIPLCLLPGYEGLYDDLKTHQFATMIEIGEPDFFPVDDKNKTHCEGCLRCSLRGPCPGLYTGYFETFGAEELRPVTNKPRSNAYHYVFEKVVGRITERGCPVLLDGVTPWDRGRHLLLRTGDRIARFRTDSRDFSDAEIEETKLSLGQVYLDVSEKTAPDDFAKDLRALQRSALCNECPARERCTQLYEPTREEVFSRDDQAVKTLLATLRGTVLDLGCGEGPYLEALAPAALQGVLRYVGVEPEASRGEAIRQRFSWATVQSCTAEAFAKEQEERVGALPMWDHVLVLRSWNHLLDPVSVLRSVLSKLRPGGTVLVVDNVAFGLVRSKVQAERGENGPAVFEHYRNDRAEQAHKVLSAGGLGLVLQEMREVGPGTSNQWFLRYVLASPEERSVETVTERV